MLWALDLAPAIRNTWSSLLFGFRFRNRLCWNTVPVGRVPSPFLVMALSALCSAGSFSQPSSSLPAPVVALILLAEEGTTEMQEVRTGLGTSPSAHCFHCCDGSTLLWGFGRLLLFEEFCSSSSSCSLLWACLLSSISSKKIWQLKPSWIPYWACSSSASSVGKTRQQATQRSP